MEELPKEEKEDEKNITCEKEIKAFYHPNIPTKGKSGLAYSIYLDNDTKYYY